jgi:bacterioferritin
LGVWTAPQGGRESGNRRDEAPEKLIGRILFLEGSPTVSGLNKITTGPYVEAHLKNDLGGEDIAVRAYNESIWLAVEMGDSGVKQPLESLLKDEEAHIDWLEGQLDQIQQMVIRNYLVEQVG